MRPSIYLILLSLYVTLCVGVVLAANNKPAGGHPVGLLDYQVGTIRAKRIEIMDDRWGIRMVLTSHEGRPAITLYTEDGEPAQVVMVGEAGVITQR